MNKYLDLVESVTADRIYAALNKAFVPGKGTLVAIGGNLHDVMPLHKMEEAIQ